MNFRDLPDGTIFQASSYLGGERPIYIKSEGQAINLNTGERTDLHWNKACDPLVLSGNFSLARRQDELMLVKRLDTHRYVGYSIFPYRIQFLTSADITFVEGGGRESHEQVYIMCRRAKTWVQFALDMLTSIERVVEEGMNGEGG